MSLISWSGGCDSTLLLYELAVKSSEEKPVRAVSLMHPQVAADVEHRKARQAILKRLRKRGHHILHQELHLRIHTSNGKRTGGGGKHAWFHCNSNGGIIQPVFWMPLAATYLGKDEDLYMGYIREDDLWQYEGNFGRAFGDLQFLMGKTGAIKYPFKLEYKWQILKRLRNVKLLDLCWYCETPKKGKACGECASCFKHKSALWQLGEKDKEEEKKKNKKGKKNAKVRSVRGRRGHAAQKASKRRR